MLSTSEVHVTDVGANTHVSLSQCIQIRGMEIGSYATAAACIAFDDIKKFVNPFVYMRRAYCVERMS